GSGSGCQSYEECTGVSLKWMATTSVRSFSSMVPSSTCDALSVPVYNLNARIIFLSPVSFVKGASIHRMAPSFRPREITASPQTIQVQHRGGIGAYASGQRGILDQRLAIKWNDFFQPRTSRWPLAHP